MLKIKPPNFKFCPFCGQKLGFRKEEGRTRKYCPSCNWTYYPHVAGGSAAVIIKNQKVLLVKRNRPPHKNTWSFPAGFIDFGEHPLEALKREVQEETGLEVKEAKLMKIIQNVDDPRSPGHFIFFYRVEVGDGKLKTDEKENQAIKWFSLKERPKIGWVSHQEIFKEIQK
jgi:8-oxo-dGTP diphosphatase